MEAKDVRFEILINNSEPRLIKHFFRWQFVLLVKKYTCFIENYFSLKLFRIFSFKIDRLTLDPDPNWAKILEPDPNSIYLDPHHWILEARNQRCVGDTFWMVRADSRQNRLNYVQFKKRNVTCEQHLLATWNDVGLAIEELFKVWCRPTGSLPSSGFGLTEPPLSDSNARDFN